jgi:GTP-binding protein
MSALFDSARFALSVAELEGLPKEGLPEIAFAGRSNAGKSTTINVLTRQTRLAFSSKTPGRTQLLNYFLLSRKGEKPGERIPVSYLVDLPGGYVTQAPFLRGMVLVMDARRPFMPADEFLLDYIAPRESLKLHFLLNKADQLGTVEKRRMLALTEKRCQEFGARATCQLFSGLKKEGVEELAEVLTGWISDNNVEGS